MTHHSFYSFFQILLELVLHPSLLLRPCYVSVDVMSRFDKVSWYHDGDIIVQSSKSVACIYILILLVREPSLVNDLCI